VEVTVKLYSGLEKHIKNYDPESGIVLRLRNGSRVRDLIEMLGLPPHGAQFVAINGEIRQPHDEIEEGDQVKVFALSAGG